MLALNDMAEFWFMLGVRNSINTIGAQILSFCTAVTICATERFDMQAGSGNHSLKAANNTDRCTVCYCGPSCSVFGDGMFCKIRRASNPEAEAVLRI